MYDLHASTRDPKSVIFDYRARIVQTTGEDWKNVKLVLSTTAAHTNIVPSLGTYKIQPGDPTIDANNTLTPGQMPAPQSNDARTITGTGHGQQGPLEWKSKQSQSIPSTEGLLSPVFQVSNSYVPKRGGVSSIGRKPMAMAVAIEPTKQPDGDSNNFIPVSSVPNLPQVSSRGTARYSTQAFTHRLRSEPLRLVEFLPRSKSKDLSAFPVTEKFIQPLSCRL